MSAAFNRDELANIFIEAYTHAASSGCYDTCQEIASGMLAYLVGRLGITEFDAGAMRPRAESAAEVTA